MPLSPEEALSIVEEDMVLVNKVQKDIDQFLAKNYVGGHISVPVKGNLSNKIIFIIERNYKATGWKSAMFKFAYGIDGYYFELEF